MSYKMRGGSEFGGFRACPQNCNATLHRKNLGVERINVITSSFLRCAFASRLFAVLCLFAACRYTNTTKDRNLLSQLRPCKHQ